MQKKDFKYFSQNLQDLYKIKWLKAYTDQNGEIFKQMKGNWLDEDLSLRTVAKLLIIETRL